MMIKYKLSEVAKDFGLSNKEISEILGKYLTAPKSNAQALKEEELDVVFESLTQSRQAADLMAALEATKAAKAEKPVKEDKPKSENVRSREAEKRKKARQKEIAALEKQLEALEEQMAACPAEDYVKLGELFQEKEAAEEALLLLYEEEEA